ncbi:hypothetical protein N7461_001500 [Penicillium sp. DV-2018c]|nr:hypothetical protein N7461_001500 [Penicillium sp. DV-2018c]
MADSGSGYEGDTHPHTTSQSGGDTHPRTIPQSGGDAHPLDVLTSKRSATTAPVTPSHNWACQTLVLSINFNPPSNAGHENVIHEVYA